MQWPPMFDAYGPLTCRPDNSPCSFAAAQKKSGAAREEVRLFIGWSNSAVKGLGRGDAERAGAVYCADAAPHAPPCVLKSADLQCGQ